MKYLNVPAACLFMALVLCVEMVFCARAPAGETEVRIATLGDSITRGVRPGVKANETFSALLQDGLVKKKFDARVINAGIGGEETNQALARLAKVIALKPNIVTIMYGTNDSYVYKGEKSPRVTLKQYQDNLRAIVKELRKAGIQPILMTPPRWGEKGKNGVGGKPNIELEKYVEGCRQVAEELKTPLVDHYAYWSKHAAKGVDIAIWTTDQYHPNPQGHREIAGIMLPVVIKALASKK